MKRILFVDDDKNVLDGMRRSLRSFRKKWDMSFANSGNEALQLLEEKRADVVVSDMRMPQMDGASLLAHIKNLYPGTIRIVLTGHTELEAAIRAIPIAHCFLSKPCEGKDVKEAIDRAFLLQNMLDDEELMRVIDGMDNLPVVPQTYSELKRVMKDEGMTLEIVARIIERDTAIASKVLRIVNSGFFGRPNRISDVKSAIGFIGLKLLETVVLSVEVFQYSGKGKMPKGFNLEKEQRHSLLVADIASEISAGGLDKNAAFMAGLLHDVGKLVIASQLPEKFSEIDALSREKGISFYLAERELGSYTHAEIGAYLANLWGLPYSIIEAIANHHHPQRVEEQQSFNLVTAVYVANQLAHKYTLDEDEYLSGIYGELDVEYLYSLNVNEKLAAWEAIADKKANLDQELV